MHDTAYLITGTIIWPVAYVAGLLLGFWNYIGQPFICPVRQSASMRVSPNVTKVTLLWRLLPHRALPRMGLRNMEHQ